MKLTKAERTILKLYREGNTVWEIALEVSKPIPIVVKILNRILDKSF